MFQVEGQVSPQNVQAVLYSVWEEGGEGKMNTLMGNGCASRGHAHLHMYSSS